MGFPGGIVDENLPANAGDTGLIPGSGKIPYAMEQLSLCATTTEPVLSVQFSRSVASDSLKSHGLQHPRPPCPSPTPGTCSNSCPLSR